METAIIILQAFVSALGLTSVILIVLNPFRFFYTQDNGVDCDSHKLGDDENKFEI